MEEFRNANHLALSYGVQGPRDVGDTRTSLALYGPRDGPIRSGWGRQLKFHIRR